MRKLYILRHGIAENVSSEYTDENRPLTEEGKENIKKLGLWLQRQSIYIDEGWSSTYKRAKQSFQYVFHTINTKRTHYYNWLLPFENPDFVINTIIESSSKFTKLAIVSHQPLIGKIIDKMFPTKSESINIQPGTLIEIQMFLNSRNKEKFKLIRMVNSYDF